MGGHAVGSAVCDQPLVVCLLQGLLCEDLSRRVAGSGIVFNVVYFDNDAVQEEGVLSSGRHGTPDQVAECLQTLAVAGGGRFHHYTLTGGLAVDPDRLPRCHWSRCLSL